MEELKHEAYVIAPDPRASPFVGLADVVSYDLYASGGRRIDASGEVEERGLAAAATTGDSDALTGGYRKGNLVEGMDPVVVRFGDVIECQNGWHQGGETSSRLGSDREA